MCVYVCVGGGGEQGFNMQQISNGSHCVKTARGGNRETCGASEGPRVRPRVATKQQPNDN
eukprot:8262894-Pyramimonas_sp.AAC.1